MDSVKTKPSIHASLLTQSPEISLLGLHMLAIRSQALASTSRGSRDRAVSS